MWENMVRTTRQCPSEAEVWSYLGHHGCLWCWVYGKFSLYLFVSASSHWVVVVCSTCSAPEQPSRVAEAGMQPRQGAPWCLLLPPHGNWSRSPVQSHVPHGVPSFTEHLLNGRVDFSFAGSGSSTLTRTTNTGYHQMNSHMQQEHRMMGSSSLTRDYSTVLMGHGEYCGDGTCPSLPPPWPSLDPCPTGPVRVRTVFTIKGAYQPEIWKVVFSPLTCRCFAKATLLPDQFGKGSHPSSAECLGKEATSLSSYHKKLHEEHVSSHSI